MSSAFSPHDPFSVNSPLSIHSVVVEENVSVRPKEAFLAHTERVVLLLRRRPVSSQAAKFCKKTLHSLPNSIRCDGIRFGNFFAGVAVQFDLNQEIELGITQMPFRNASMEEVPQQCVTFQGFVVR